MVAAPLTPQKSFVLLCVLGVTSFLSRSVRMGRLLSTRVNEFDHKLYLSSRIDTTVLHNRSTIHSDSATNKETGLSQGIFVLGMHRSGTSMLSGLLEAHGYSTLGFTKPGSTFNAKGYFELQTLVNQNMIWIEEQCGERSQNFMACFNASRASAPNEMDGQATIDATRNVSHVPWLLKDPRLCVTLPAWLRYMHSDNDDASPLPAAVFIYRHPLEVALSINKRAGRTWLLPALRSWMTHNQLAIQNSQHMCRVITDVETIHQNPLGELTRISNELTFRCGVAAPRRKLTQEIVNLFVDPSLRHQMASSEHPGTDNDGMVAVISNDIETGKANPSDHSGTSLCTFQDHPSVTRPTEKRLYQVAAEWYCNMKSGKAFKPGYTWPRTTNRTES